MPEFPYAETSFHLEGTLLYKTADDNALLQEEKLLAERKQNAERKKLGETTGSTSFGNLHYNILKTKKAKKTKFA